MLGPLWPNLVPSGIKWPHKRKTENLSFYFLISFSRFWRHKVNNPWKCVQCCVNSSENPIQEFSLPYGGLVPLEVCRSWVVQKRITMLFRLQTQGIVIEFWVLPLCGVFMLTQNAPGKNSKKVIRSLRKRKSFQIKILSFHNFEGKNIKNYCRNNCFRKYSNLDILLKNDQEK